MTFRMHQTFAILSFFIIIIIIIIKLKKPWHMYLHLNMERSYI